MDGTAIAWKGWRQPVGMEVKLVRFGRHWTVKRRRLVPQISPLLPEMPRAVLRGERASVWGTVPEQALERKSGTLAVGIDDLDRFVGYYTDEHIIDMNDDSHSFTRELAAGVEGALPLAFPPLPERLRAFIDSVLGRGAPEGGGGAAPGG